VSALHVVGGVALVDGAVVDADVVVDAGVVTAVGGRRPAGADVLDATDAIVAPGFVDLQLNGGAGIDLTSEPERLLELAAVLPRYGVTAYLPTIVTSPSLARRRAIDALRASRSGPLPAGVARPLGLHVEGPMIAMERRGAHTARHIGPVPADELAGWHGDEVALVTLAPELPGALDVIAALRSRGVAVSVGHTDAGPDVVAAARRAGATMVTHLFNAMSPFGHRDPGTVGAVLADDELVAGLICDGIHVDPVAVRVAWRALGPDRIVLVTDAVAALGEPHGRHRLGRAEIVVDERGVRTPDGVLAGSNLSMDAAVRNLVAFTGCSTTEAVGAATATPARVLGRRDVGSLRVGAPADLVVLEQDLTVRATVVAGVVAWRS
jgi:N-acetylglucosamine-6-phosphate deacetylase